MPASPAEAERLLGAGELVGVFPEGFKGIGKPFSDRYQLQRFGRGGFARLALRTGVPLIPCAIVGAEEIYPMVADWPRTRRQAEAAVLPGHAALPVARAARRDAAAVQLDDRVLRSGATDGFTPDQGDDEDVIAELAGKVKDTIASKIDELLAERGPAFGD